MTPKEKSKELIDKFYQTTPNESFYNPPIGSFSSKYTSYGQAIQCALIAVDEIIAALDWHPFEAPNEAIEFWGKVKQELM